MSIVANRRSFITGMGALFAAPAIVRVASIMPVKAVRSSMILRTSLPAGTWRVLNMGMAWHFSPAIGALPDAAMLSLMRTGRL